MTRRALIVGARDQRPKYRVEPWPSIDTMRGLLEELRGWTIEVVEGEAASRVGILDALSRLVASIEPDDAVLFYFFGHGGVVRFTESPAWLGDRPVFYICASRKSDHEEMTGVLDVELSAILTEVDRICGNVSVLLDCCHSAQIVRDSIRRSSPPSWLSAVELPDAYGSLPTRDPRIVRLAGTSALEYAYATRAEGGSLGLLTEGFAAVLREADLAVDRLCWDAVAHRVREYAIQARRAEKQWVTLAGPGSRLVFGRERVAVAHSVGFLAGRSGGPGWLRAGMLQGLRVGDEFGIAALTLGSDRQPRIRARVRVVEVELSRARVESLDLENDANLLPDGSSAVLLQARTRQAVVVEGSDLLTQALSDSPLVCSAPSDEHRIWARAFVDDQGLGVRVRLARVDGSTDVAATFSDTHCACAWAIEFLEDWARAESLLRALAECPIAADELPVAVSWGRCKGQRDEALPIDCPDLELCEGDLVYFELTHRGSTPETWYVSAVEIGVDGRAVLVDPSEPEGRAVASRQSVYLGRRARNFKTGRTLDWPHVVERDRPRAASIVFLMSRRPLELGHIVGAQTEGLANRWLEDQPPRTRGKGADPGWIAPQTSWKWAAAVLRYWVSPARAS